MKMKFTHLMLAMAGAMLALPLMAQTSDDSQETWKFIGTGKYREVSTHGQWVFASYPEIDVEMEESEQTPGRYRLVNAYANYPDFFGGSHMREGTFYIVIDASDPECVYIERSLTGFVYGLNDADRPLELIVHSVAGHMLDEEGKSKQEVKDAGEFGKLENGCITFPEGSILGGSRDYEGAAAGLYEDDDPAKWLYKRCNKSGNFRVKLPGAPMLDVESTFAGIDDAHTTLTYNVALASDVQKAKCALVEDEAGLTQVNRIISGEIPSQEITASGEVKVPYTADGQFTFVVVPYYNDKPYTPVYLTHELSYDESVWRKAGQAQMEETLLSSIELLSAMGVGFPAVQYMVDVEENVERPGYIRLVNPYGVNYPYSDQYNYDSSRNWHIYIDASDPDHVFVEHSDALGIDAGYGQVELWSRYGRALGDESSIYYGWSMEQCEKAGFFGRFANNEITFPKDALCLRMPSTAPGWYICNQNGKFSLKFQEGQLRGEQSGVESVVVDNSDAAAEYYRLDGIRVAADALTPGVYVVRRGTETSKVIVK